jgi:hypothetical protein
MLLDMLETVHVKLYFSNEHIIYDSDGVDLVEFNSAEKDIKSET